MSLSRRESAASTLLPPILNGGVRNYDTAQAVLEEFLGQ